MVKPVSSDLLIAGGGLAGIVTALEALRAGKSVTIVDRDSPERFGGLALWAFGGMMLIDTPLQRRMRIADSPELALNDWLRFGELDPNDEWPVQWARYYVEHSRTEVHDWLANEGIKFMPAVNWVERGRFGDGNSVPRYHITWGTSRELVRCMVNALHEADTGGRLAIHHRHRITALDHQAGEVCGAVAINEETGEEVRFEAPNVVLAMGGINGSHAECRTNWPRHRPQPDTMLNGAHPFADGKLHHWAKDHLGARITHAGEMWNYAAGFPHPYPHFPGHGLSTIPCKSALWLNHRGERIGPEPLVTGFDTHWLCQRVAEQEGDHQETEHRHAHEAPEILAQNDHRQEELQSQSPEERARLDLVAVIGEAPSNVEQRHQAEDRYVLEDVGCQQANEGSQRHRPDRPFALHALELLVGGGPRRCGRSTPAPRRQPAWTAQVRRSIWQPQAPPRTVWPAHLRKPKVLNRVRLRWL